MLPRDAGTDQLLLDIADYVVGYEIKSRDAVKTARYAVLDAMACSMLSLNFPECAKLLGPVVPGATVSPSISKWSRVIRYRASWSCRPPPFFPRNR